jgi:hypothetical protein
MDRETIRLSLDSNNLSLETDTVEAQIRDLTSKVRYDPTGIRVETQSWKVQIVLPDDFKGDGDVDGLGIHRFKDAYAAENQTADIKGLSEVNGKDVSAFAEHFGSSPGEGIE